MIIRFWKVELANSNVEVENAYNWHHQCSLLVSNTWQEHGVWRAANNPTLVVLFAYRLCCFILYDVLGICFFFPVWCRIRLYRFLIIVLSSNSRVYSNAVVVVNEFARSAIKWCLTTVRWITFDKPKVNCGLILHTRIPEIPFSYLLSLQALIVSICNDDQMTFGRIKYQ